MILQGAHQGASSGSYRFHWDFFMGSKDFLFNADWECTARWHPHLGTFQGHSVELLDTFFHPFAASKPLACTCSIHTVGWLCAVVEVLVKQGVRLLIKPGTFFNQLQWSTHHWIILIAFMIVASLETHLGKSHYFYQVFADSLTSRTGMSWNQAIWLVTSIKLAVMVAGSFVLASFVWLVGNMFGRRTSKRVLFRRLAVVFTVLLAGYTLQHVAKTDENLQLFAYGLYIWGLILGYFAIREQFNLNHLETMVLGIFALLAVTSSWHYANHFMERAARQELVQLVKKQAPAIHNRFR